MSKASKEGDVIASHPDLASGVAHRAVAESSSCLRTRVGHYMVFKNYYFLRACSCSRSSINKN